MRRARRTVLAGLAACAAAPALAQTPIAGAQVELRTGLGLIVLTLALVRAPVTSLNFLRYVDSRRLESASFYRADKTSAAPPAGLIQGGLQNAAALAPIAHESTAATGLTHTDGVLSMARYAPGTATSEFFICVGDQTYLDADPKAPGDNLGFAAFGAVSAGMDVVRAILASPVSPTKGEGAMRGQMLDPPIPILGARRLA